jgi:hypothetical protein
LPDINSFFVAVFGTTVPTFEDIEKFVPKFSPMLPDSDLTIISTVFGIVINYYTITDDFEVFFKKNITIT